MLRKSTVLLALTRLPQNGEGGRGGLVTFARKVVNFLHLALRYNQIPE